MDNPETLTTRMDNPETLTTINRTEANKTKKHHTENME